MPVVTAVDKIKQANLDKLHDMLRPGNEKKLIPGLKRTEFLRKNNAKLARYDWMSDELLSALKNNTLKQSGYSLLSDFPSWVQAMGFKPDTPVNQLKLIAGILLIWPHVEDVLEDPFSQSLSKEFIQEQLVIFYQEREAYLRKKQQLLSFIDTENNPLAPIKTIIDRMDKTAYQPLRDQTRLFECVCLFIKKKKTATECIEVVKSVFNNSRIKIASGVGLEILGVILIVASIACALGTFGLLNPMSMIGVYFGLHCLMGFICAAMFGAGCYSIPIGVGFFKQGRLNRQFVNQFEAFFTTHARNESSTIQLKEQILDESSSCCIIQ